MKRKKKIIMMRAYLYAEGIIKKKKGVKANHYHHIVIGFLLLFLPLPVLQINSPKKGGRNLT